MERKIRVALLFGGRSAEHEVSLVSAASIYKNLKPGKFEVLSIYINKSGLWSVVDSPLLSEADLNEGVFFSFLPWKNKDIACLQAWEADIYFPVLHGPYGEDGTLQGLLELADVPYVGASVMSSAIGMDKAVSKTLFKAKRLPVVNHSVFRKQDWILNEESILNSIRSEFSAPFFVKPANLGSSVGITKVKDFSKTQKALEKAFLYDKKILVEEGIKGREIECSVLGNTSPRASLPGEIIPYREFYDYEDKYKEGKTSFGIPAEISRSLSEEIQRLSIEAYKAIDCSGMARVDFFLEENSNKIYLSEVNTIPGFTEISMYPKLWEVSGLPFPNLLEELITLGFESHKQKNRSIARDFP